MCWLIWVIKVLQQTTNSIHYAFLLGDQQKVNLIQTQNCHNVRRIITSQLVVYEYA